jgi:hypothetical protein
MSSDGTVLDALGDAMVALPEEIVTQWQAYLELHGMSTMGELFVRVLMHAEQCLDYDALVMLLQGAAHRIAYRGPDQAPLNISKLPPAVVIYRYTRKLAQMMTDEAGLPDVPGAAALAKTRRYARKSPVHLERGYKPASRLPRWTSPRTPTGPQLRVLEGGKASTTASPRAAQMRPGGEGSDAA